MDLRGSTNGLVFNWDVGAVDTTLTIYNFDKTVILGEIIIENNKLRSVQDAMAQVGQHLFPNTDGHLFVNQKTIFNQQTKDATLTWV